MKKSLVAFALVMIWSFSSMAWAVDNSLTIAYSVQNTTSDATTTTLNLAVELTNNAAGTMSGVSLRLAFLGAADRAIQGQILFPDAITEGQVKTATGTFLVPKDFLVGTTLNSLAWKVSYVDAQGQTQTKIIPGLRR